jgi:CBS-domain-containing membrane protein
MIQIGMVMACASIGDYLGALFGFSQPRSGRNSKPSSSARAAARRLTCGEVFDKPNMIGYEVSVSHLIHTMTTHEWDHVFLIDDDRLPVGRVHAVDLLKLFDLKRVNRDLAWSEAIPAHQCITHPPLQVNTHTPLLKAAVLLLTHDLNQLAVVDEEGTLIGAISNATVARHLPRFIR